MGKLCYRLCLTIIVITTLFGAAHAVVGCVLMFWQHFSSFFSFLGQFASKSKFNFFNEYLRNTFSCLKKKKNPKIVQTILHSKRACTKQTNLFGVPFPTLCAGVGEILAMRRVCIFYEFYVGNDFRNNAFWPGRRKHNLAKVANIRTV